MKAYIYLFFWVSILTLNAHDCAAVWWHCIDNTYILHRTSPITKENFITYIERISKDVYHLSFPIPNPFTIITSFMSTEDEQQMALFKKLVATLAEKLEDLFHKAGHPSAVYDKIDDLLDQLSILEKFENFDQMVHFRQHITTFSAINRLLDDLR